MSLPKDMLGRFEYTNESENSDKFWQIKPHPEGYLAEWGRNGRPPQASKVYTESEAHKKIGEKMSKGYQKVGAIPGRHVQVFPIKKTSKPRAKRNTAASILGQIDFYEELRKSIGGK